MKKQLLITTLATCALTLGCTMASYAYAIGSPEYHTVINTENGPRFLSNKSADGNIWAGGFQWVDMDQDNIFDCRYFLEESQPEKGDQGYLYQSGMELSDTDQKTLDEIINKRWAAKNGQLYNFEGRPFQAYKYGQSQENNGTQYKFGHFTFNDPENRLGKMQLESISDVNVSVTYYPESVFELEKTNGERYYEQADEWKALASLCIESDYSYVGQTDSAAQRMKADYENWYTPDHGYTKYTDPDGIVWYMALDSNTFTAFCYDLDHRIQPTESFAQKMTGLCYSGRISIYNPAKAGIDQNYFMENIKLVR